ncbi:MAG: PAS domain-containing sensor histidine kinase [Gammaproteobacteria bacterium]|nr:PAS domain-containing sensor histidine kinase [Gammaproteobacteria bacterium]MBU6509305.1 PAS domain-containing sensor histidine kinase [Gammaproteobacteria bacterium]MDE1983494.1 PAS domain-containing sensor histidine kinase [Gammaproteobacteria bacterium]MDE2108953.1 PAS domain-containing sensor histidine kinase [Gammaproteobacteria bacterium]
MPDLSARAQLPGFTDSLTTGLLWLDDFLRFRYVNPAAKTLLDLDGQLIRSEPVAKALAGNDTFFAILERVRSTRETVTQRELLLDVGLPDTRHKVTVDCTVTALSESEEIPELLVELIPLDRHMRISHEAGLAQQSGINRALARALAHEIKNPLGGIRAAAQLLERKLPQPKMAEYTRVIVSEVDRLAALVDKLLGPARPATPVEVNLHALLDHVARLMGEGAGPKILRDYDPSLPELMLDRDQIVQALLNLAKNAGEAAGADGRVTFRTRSLRQFTLNGVRHRLMACADIEDDGPGIPPDVRPKLFMPLTSSKPQGSGLGLSIAQELVSRQGGLIEYTSRPGCTVFSVLLPVEAADAHASA